MKDHQKIFLFLWGTTGGMLLWMLFFAHYFPQDLKDTNHGAALLFSTVGVTTGIALTVRFWLRKKWGIARFDAAMWEMRHGQSGKYIWMVVGIIVLLKVLVEILHDAFPAGRH